MAPLAVHACSALWTMYALMRLATWVHAFAFALACASSQRIVHCALPWNLLPRASVYTAHGVARVCACKQSQSVPVSEVNSAQSMQRMA